MRHRYVRRTWVLASFSTIIQSGFLLQTALDTLEADFQFKEGEFEKEVELRGEHLEEIQALKKDLKIAEENIFSLESEVRSMCL